MGPTQNDFVNQFEQQVSGPSSSKGGDIILTPDQTQKSKKPIIIAAAAVVFLLIVAVAVFALKGKSGGNSGNFNAIIKDYAMSIAYGPNQSGHSFDEIKELDENAFYIANYEEANTAYLETLEETLVKAEQSAKEKASIREQLNAIRFFIVASSYTDDSIALSEKRQYSIPEDANLELVNAYDILGWYIETTEKKSEMLEEYGNGDISYDDYLDYVIAQGDARGALSQEYFKFRNKIINYVRSL